MLGTLGYIGGCWALPEEFTFSMISHVAYHERKGQRWHYVRVRQSDLPTARNELVKVFLNAPGEWLLMLDVDHIVPVDLAEKMVTTAVKHHTPILSGVAVYKTPPYSPNVYMRTEDGHYSVVHNWYVTPDPQGNAPEIEVLKVDGVGAACLLIHRYVLEQERFKDPFSRVRDLSEDLSFCERVRDSLPIHAAVNIHYPHLVVNSVTLANRQALAHGETEPVIGTGGFKSDEGDTK